MKARLFFTALFLSILFLTNSFGQSYIINVEAGIGKLGYSGDGGLAIHAEMGNPAYLAVDSLGNLYIADFWSNSIRMVSPSGIITTIAGGNAAGYSGDGGPATFAQLNGAPGVTVDNSGNIFIADASNNVIRKVNNKGIISTIVGTGKAGYSGDGGAATSAELNNPFNVIVDKDGNLYIDDQSNIRIRKVSSSGIISTFAGNGKAGYTGDGGNADTTELNQQSGIAVDDSGNVFINDGGRIRKVDTKGIISTIKIVSCGGIAIDDSDNIYCEGYNYTIQKINKKGTISTIAGSGQQGSSGNGGPADSAEINTNSPYGIIVDASGIIYFSDSYNYQVRKLTNVLAGIKEISNNNNLMELYPNPNNGLFTISIAQINSRPRLEVYNVFGKIICQSILNSNNIKVNLSACSQGVYLYRVINESGKLLANGKFIIQ